MTAARGCAGCAGRGAGELLRQRVCSVPWQSPGFTKLDLNDFF